MSTTKSTVKLKTVSNENVFNNTYNIASGGKFGATAKSRYIIDAIHLALQKASLKSASSVLLFLSNGYTQDLKNSLKIAAKAAGTIQVYGATASGLLTDTQWVLDHEGVVAMVFPEKCDLQPANLLEAQGKLNLSLPLICLSSPEQSNVAISHSSWQQHQQFGAITSNAYGTSEYPIWQTSRIVKNGFLHANFHTSADIDLKAHTIISQGIRRISGNLLINDAKDNCVTKVDNQAPTESLQKTIPSDMYSMFLEQPHHTLCAVSEAEHTDKGAEDKTVLNALNKSFYRLFNIVGIDEQQHAIYLSGKVKENQSCFWALRDSAIAEQEWDSSLKKLSETTKNPVFAIIFCSESRGPYFYRNNHRKNLKNSDESNDDIDLKLYKKHFPNTPLIGIYSSAEITTGAQHKNLLRRYSSALTLYTV